MLTHFFCLCGQAKLLPKKKIQHPMHECTERNFMVDRFSATTTTTTNTHCFGSKLHRVTVVVIRWFGLLFSVVCPVFSVSVFHCTHYSQRQSQRSEQPKQPLKCISQLIATAPIQVQTNVDFVGVGIGCWAIGISECATWRELFMRAKKRTTYCAGGKRGGWVEQWCRGAAMEMYEEPRRKPNDEEAA